MRKTANTTQKTNKKKASFRYKQEGRFCLDVANNKIKEGTITGKQCPVFDYIGKI